MAILLGFKGENQEELEKEGKVAIWELGEKGEVYVFCWFNP